MSVPLDNHPYGLDPDEESKLSLLRRIAEEAFRELDRGEFEIIPPDGIDEFLAEVDASIRGPKPL